MKTVNYLKKNVKHKIITNRNYTPPIERMKEAVLG